VNLLLGNGPLSSASKINARHSRVFPSQGGQITLGDLKLQGQINNLRLLQQHYCLLALTESAQPNAAASACGLQASVGEDGKHFFSDLNLSPDGFYHLTADRSQITVY
jgi:hypothetical protein